ncbi:MAG: hypothetical protein K0Q74_1480 [Gammaproteobacteria bacterium]|jgi:hypothetical protein|nr:hypothetical protein [Gammaproteobacteria bacterium]
MEHNDLLKILHGDISHINEVNKSDIALYGMNVIVYPRDVKKMLKLYLEDKISSGDLTNWAAFICIRAEYCIPNYMDDDDEIADYYEDMFYVIQRLSTPKLDGEVNKIRVTSYLNELKKYPDDII